MLHDEHVASITNWRSVRQTYTASEHEGPVPVRQSLVIRYLSVITRRGIRGSELVVTLCAFRQFVLRLIIRDTDDGGSLDTGLAGRKIVRRGRSVNSTIH
jgi:hypothetical protein